MLSSLALDHIAKTMKVSTYEVKLMSCFLVSYPLAGVLVCISSARHKNLLVIGISLFYLIGIFDLWSGLRTLMISSAGAYTIAKYISGSAMPWIGFVFLMAHLSISHVTKVPGTQGMSIVGAQMVTVIKLSSFCWNVHDGRQPDAELSQRQRQRAINTLPPLLEYAGYVLFFPTLFVGPAFDFAEYQRWLTRDQSMGSRQLLTAARKAAHGLLWTVAFYKVSRLYSPWILLSYEAMQRSILKRVWHMYVLGLSTRMRYYGFWNLVEGACIVSGISFNGVDLQTGHVRWDGMENAKPLKLEFAQAAEVYVRNWNIHTHLWLRDYVYLRCPYPTSKKHPGFLARTISFIVSALWHGFNPGHYLSFIAAAVIQTIAKEARRRIRPLFLDFKGHPLPSKRYYDVLTWFVSQLAVAYIVVPFAFPNFKAALLVWGRVSPAAAWKDEKHYGYPKRGNEPWPGHAN